MANHVSDQHHVNRSANQRKECVMKLNSAQIEQTLAQFEARVVPDDHPVVSELSQLFGNHTFFLDSKGLNVVEPNEGVEAGAPAGTVINLASWSDARMTSLAPHEPEPTEVVVMLESEH
jgi:hypothetical protein